MLPTELLMFRLKAGLVIPRRLKATQSTLSLVKQVIAIFEANLNKRRNEIDEDLKALEAGRPDYKVIRGLAHILSQSAASFKTTDDIDPVLVRAKVFELAQANPPSRHRRSIVLTQAAAALATEKAISAEDLSELLYSDLPDQQRMLSFDPPEPQELLERFNLAQAQGMLYRAYSLIITARRNEPARYKQLLKYVKLFGLMVTVEGDADYGFTLTMDGPTSLFSSTTRYGLAMAKFLPALLHVTKWDLTAMLKPRKDLSWVDQDEREWLFELTSEDGYISHYKPPEEHDSALEAGFVDRFTKSATDWILEREVDLVPVPGGVIIPDFRLIHPSGQSVLLEIVGYWRPEYLRKKFELLRKSGRLDVIICVSERLNLERAGVDPKEFDERLIWFKGVLNPKDVLVVAERLVGLPT